MTAPVGIGMHICSKIEGSGGSVKACRGECEKGLTLPSGVVQNFEALKQGYYQKVFFTPDNFERYVKDKIEM